MVEFINWFVGGSLLAVLCTQILKELLGKIENRWGKTITLLMLLVVSFGVAGFGILFQFLPAEFAQTTITLFTGAIAIYEIFYKALYQGVVKGNE